MASKKKSVGRSRKGAKARDGALKRRAGATKRAAKGKRASASAASVMVDLVLRYSGGLQFKKALVNNVKLPFSGGVARFSVKAGINYKLQWVVDGFVGTKWSFKLATESQGYAVKPAVLSSAGRSYVLQSPRETEEESFKIEAQSGDGA